MMNVNQNSKFVILSAAKNLRSVRFFVALRMTKYYFRVLDIHHSVFLIHHFL